MKCWDQMPWSSFSECWALSQLFHSPLTFIKRLFSSSSLSAIRLVSSAYLRLLIFLPDYSTGTLILQEKNKTPRHRERNWWDGELEEAESDHQVIWNTKAEAFPNEMVQTQKSKECSCEQGTHTSHFAGLERLVRKAGFLDEVWIGADHQGQHVHD